MFVEKIEVPAFRALRDVVFEFAPQDHPKVFPLGSQNGGGKSTLLQLVFMLLQSVGSVSYAAYLRNLLSIDAYPGTEATRTLARFTLRMGDARHVLEFLSLNNAFLADKLDVQLKYGFGTSDRKRRLGRDKSQKDENRQGKLKALDADIERIQNLMRALDYDWLASYQRPTPAGKTWHAVVCHLEGVDAEERQRVLDDISGQVFLLGPSNQQYLFVDKSTRHALLEPRDETGSEEEYVPNDPPADPSHIAYFKAVAEADRELPGFYAYDWLSVEPLLRLFTEAKDDDFKTMVKTGSYGDRYKAILAEVNELLLGKEVRPLPDLTGVEFIAKDAQGNETSLHPADLSQGELKRLLMFAWLRAKNANDALVLIDEIETSFHPDWQIGIVRDLQEWGPGNQYILATHSVDLCQLLTPRHVKVLEPHLAKPDHAAAGPTRGTAGPNE